MLLVSATEVVAHLLLSLRDYKLRYQSMSVKLKKYS